MFYPRCVVDKRYSSQIRLPEIGHKGQEKLRNAKLLCIGAGGLASSVLPYLVAAGVGYITICDADVIEEPNLNRQIYFNLNELGKNKAITLTNKLQLQNPSIMIVGISQNLGLENSLALISSHDLVLDCSDDYETKLLINDSCRKLSKPWVYASVLGFDGQVILFANNENNPNTPCLRCYLHHAPIGQTSCNNSGVLGASVNLIGSYQATLAIQALLANFDNAYRIWVFDLWSLESNYFLLNSHCSHSVLDLAYLSYGISLEQLIAKSYLLIDVRTLIEWEDGHIPDAKQISIGSIVSSPDSYFKKDDQVVLYCNKEDLSKLATENLRKLGYQAWWLKEGYLGYIKHKL